MAGRTRRRSASAPPTSNHEGEIIHSAGRQAAHRTAGVALAALVCFAGGACSLRSLDRLSSGGVADGGARAPDRVIPPADARRPDAAPPAIDATPAMPDAPPPVSVASIDAAAEGPRPDAAPDAQRAGKVYFIVGSVKHDQADAILQRRLTDRGLEVILVQDDKLTTVDTAPASLILLSQTASVAMVGARFRDVPKPVLLFEPLLYDDMGMVSATTAGNRGVATGVSALQIETPASPLAAGLTGTVTVLTAPGDISWGIPGDRAVRVASVAGSPSLIASFTYESGVPMPELIAPARRAGLFLAATSVPNLTASGWALFDAAVSWALASP
jgi:hypothetical protein